MSIQCPKCGTELTQDFGLATCPKCTAVLSIDVDGQVQLASEDFHQNTNTNMQAPAPHAMELETPPQEIVQEIQAAPIEPSYSMEPVSPIPETIQEANHEIAPEMSAEPLPVETEPVAEIMNDNMQPQATFEPEPVAPVEEETAQTWVKPKSAIQEIQEYGNKEVKTGPISYTVVIHNLELPDTISEVMSALSDPKFDWQTSDLKKKIKHGQLQIDDLNPAQAVMVIKKLRGIHVQISWTQSIYS